MSKICLSLCMPTHNFGRFLKETLDSITPQLSPEVELILLDGGSTDDTPSIGREYASKFPNIYYHRRDKKGGIDRDMALSVSLSQGEYVWLFSSDDVMRPGAVSRVLEEIRAKLDVYICGFTICGFDVSQTYWEHPIFNIKETTTFDLCDPVQRKHFFEKSLTTTAFFSFMGSLIFQKKKWDETEVEEEFYTSCWAHVARIFRMDQEKGLKVRYLKDSLLLKRGFNDSFLDKGAVHRFAITVDGYHRIAEKFFAEASFEAFHIRRVVVCELPLKLILISGKSQLKTKEEKQRLDALVLKLYKDPSFLNTLRKKVYFATPRWLLKWLAFVYQHRSFFKYFRLQRLKHFLNRA